VIIGNSNSANGGGVFVRREGDEQSWLASPSITVAKTILDWEKRELVDSPGDRLKSVRFTSPDGVKAAIYKDDAAGDHDFKLADVPKGREAGSEYSVNGLASTLGGLRFDDVIAAKDAPPGDKPLKAHFATFDGLVVDVIAWEKDGKDYAQFVASADPDRANQHIAAAQAKAKSDYDAQVAAQQKSTPAADASKAADTNTPAAAEPQKPAAVSDPAKDREQRLAALDTEVADLNAHFKDWTYVLPAYKFASINKSMDDLLKPLDDKKDDKKPAASKKPPVMPAKKSG